MPALVTDREALLEAIRANSDEDTPRLVYADWLDADGSGDLDRATAEFVRVSCAMKPPAGRKVMPAAAYAWLRGNWRRLVPSVFEKHVPQLAPNRGDILYYPKGRVIWAKVHLPGFRWRADTGERVVYGFACEFEFWKGFLVAFTCWSEFPRDQLMPGLKAEQPFCRFKVPDRNRPRWAGH